MGIRIEEQFDIVAPVDAVWAFLVDPERVVRCLPGAELTGTAEDGSFLGRVKVKVGPVTVGYSGRARFTEKDETAHHARLTAEGKEAGGAGSARMTMDSTIEETPENGSIVSVDVDLEVVGKLVQFGRGMIEEVSRQMFRQFSTCMRAALEPASDEAAAPASAAAHAPPRGYDTSPTPGPGAATPLGGAAAAGATSRAHEPTPPLRLLPLLWSAFVARLRRFFGRRPDTPPRP